MKLTARDRVGAALGAGFVTLIFVGNGMSTAGTDQSGHASGAHVLRDVVHAHTSAAATVGTVLEVLGFTMLFGFLGYLADVSRRYGGSWRAPSSTAVVAAVVMLAVKIGSWGPMLVLDLDRRTLTPQLAQVLNDTGSALFVVSWLPAAVFIGATATALRQAGAIGRPTHWLGVFLGVAGVALTVLGAHDISNANPLAFVLGLFWLLVVSIRLVVRPAGSDEAVVVLPDSRVAVSA